MELSKSANPPPPPPPPTPATAPTEAPPLTRGQKFRLVVKVVELRLRFIVLMAATGLVFAYWDTIWNRYDKWMRPAADRHAAASNFEYYCPMHPQVVQQEPGTCPICGMPLARRAKGEKTVLPPGVTARVALSSARVSQAGITTVEASYAPLTQTLSTVGYVAFDERRMANIVSKVPGKTRVEKLYVNFTGQDVVAGHPLAELYSPELAQAVQELLTSTRRASASGSHTQTSASRGLLRDEQDMVRASAEKLKRWGITQEQVDGITKTGKADFTFPIYSPIGGHVFKKNVVEGQEVPEGFVMFEVADLQTVWVQARVFEQQIGLVREGQPVEATVEAFPGKTFSGRVEFVQPHLDPATRTVEVRYALENPGHVLRPGMFATVTLNTPVAKMLDLPTRTASTPTSSAPRTTRRAILTAAEQEVCPVTKALLGSMGEPVSIDLAGRKVWLCCGACEAKLRQKPDEFLANLPHEQAMSATAASVEENPTPTPAEQGVCPVTGAKLGSMGEPILVEVEGRKVWVCCPGCPDKLKANPAKYLARIAPAPADEVLSIPEAAVVDTGIRKVVYVESAPGVYEGRAVVLGPRIDGRFPVVSGLFPGEKVAATGAFLIDAESRINPSAAPGEKGGPSASVAPARSAAAPTAGVHVH